MGGTSYTGRLISQMNWFKKIIKAERVKIHFFFIDLCICQNERKKYMNSFFFLNEKC